MGASVWMRGLCVLSLCLLLLSGIARADTEYIGKVDPGLEGTQMNWIDKNGLFLKSNSSIFGFGFTTLSDPTKFLLSIVHLGTQTAVWSANADSPVSNTDKFGFDESGNLFLQKDGTNVWSTGTSDKGVSAMELLDSGNLVLVRKDGVVVWQSFGHPTDTLLSGQEFVEGMKLSSSGSKNLSYILEIKSGDLVLSAGFKTPQPYWSFLQDHRKINNKNGGKIASALIDSKTWNLYDEDKVLLWEFLLTGSDPKATWIAVLGSDGSISFTSLPQTGSASESPTKIPEDSCSTPVPCDPYMVCSGGNKCSCLRALTPYPNCSPGIDSPCSVSKESLDLVSAGDGVDYFALGFVSPSLKSNNLDTCKASCVSNCSCLAVFFQNSTGNCYMFDSVGALSSDQSSGYAAFIKVSRGSGTSSGGGGGGNTKHLPITISIVVSTMLIILGLVYGGFRYFKAKRKQPETPEGSEDNFLESLSGMPTRFSYKDLQTATNNFTVKLGQGGFGSVYQGVLPDGTRLAVKKLEGLGQGKKEFRAEVCIIGSIHHHHLVRLRGFCAEGTHRLLAYEFMANGSLDKWIFGKNKSDILDWDTRFNIAIGTAKGLAYLHEDCDVKIVHCDIKPENVLIDDKFLAKVSDFGLAKLMTREQSHVFTTMRGTRGYLAPEWITNYAISEKSDVYSYGMLLLEIIGGRKNYDSKETSDKSHFPSYAFKMMEEGKLRDILDSKLNFDEKDERVLTAIMVALWCIQEDMYLRPPMTKVVQMLEGLCPVPQPPISSPLGSRLYSSLFKSVSEEGTSSGPSDCNSEAYQSAVRLSGPR